jgi:hypothetical protein
MKLKLNKELDCVLNILSNMKLLEKCSRIRNFGQKNGCNLPVNPLAPEVSALCDMQQTRI